MLVGLPLLCLEVVYVCCWGSHSCFQRLYTYVGGAHTLVFRGCIHMLVGLILLRLEVVCVCWWGSHSCVQRLYTYVGRAHTPVFRGCKCLEFVFSVSQLRYVPIFVERHNSFFSFWINELAEQLFYLLPSVKFFNIKLPLYEMTVYKHVKLQFSVLFYELKLTFYQLQIHSLSCFFASSMYISQGKVFIKIFYYGFCHQKRYP